MLTFNVLLKALGALLLFTSALIWSEKNRQTGKERLSRLRGQIAFVGFIRERIERYLLPISQIIKECDSKVMDAVTMGCDGSEYADVEGLRTLLRSGKYYSDGGAAFDRFLSTLGASYREDEVAGCDDCLKSLNTLYDRLSREIPKDVKSRAVLAFCLCAAIVIILF